MSPAEGINVFKSGKFYTISTNFGLTVRYDGKHFMDIKVIKRWVVAIGDPFLINTQQLWQKLHYELYVVLLQFNMQVAGTKDSQDTDNATIGLSPNLI